MIIEQTADGYDTLYLPGIDERYHSAKGACSESMHVFIAMGFNHCTSQSPKVIEFGFGTGLNALLTANEANKQGKKTTYIALELHPLPGNIISALNYTSHMDAGQASTFAKMHEAEWGKPVEIAPCFTIEKIKCDFTESSQWKTKGPFDVVYFDAFAPEKQPEAWSSQLLGEIAESMASGASFVTYCAKGARRRCLQDIGLTVERLPGPPNGKREIIRATRPDTRQT